MGTEGRFRCVRMPRQRAGATSSPQPKAPYFLLRTPIPCRIAGVARLKTRLKTRKQRLGKSLHPIAIAGLYHHRPPIPNGDFPERYAYGLRVEGKMRVSRKHVDLPPSLPLRPEEVFSVGGNCVRVEGETRSFLSPSEGHAYDRDIGSLDLNETQHHGLRAAHMGSLDAGPTRATERYLRFAAGQSCGNRVSREIDFGAPIVPPATC